MSMTFDEYIEKRVHQVSVDFANNLWYHGVHDLEKIWILWTQDDGREYNFAYRNS